MKHMKYVINEINTEELRIKYCTEAVMDYIMENEAEDFFENPSHNHVYYKAVVVRLGKGYADKLFEDAVKFQQGEEK